MTQPKTEIASFRIRSFRCSACNIHMQLFGQEKEPTVCPHCGKPALIEEFDKLVTYTKTTQDYVQS